MLVQIINSLTKQQKVDLYAKDIPPQTISYWRTGRRMPTFEQCVSLAEVTGADLSNLLIKVALSKATPEQKQKFKHLLNSN